MIRSTAVASYSTSTASRLAFVAVDLGVYTSTNVEAVCKEKYNIAKVILCSSHNHTAPSRPGKTPGTANLKTFYDNQIITLVGSAVSNMFPARLAAGRRSFPQLGFKRLIVRDDGHARESWMGDDHYRAINPERIPFGPVDDEVGVIRIEDMNGRPRVIVMNYACHADVVCQSYAISADYPGAAARKVEDAFPARLSVRQWCCRQRRPAVHRPAPQWPDRSLQDRLCADGTHGRVVGD